MIRLPGVAPENCRRRVQHDIFGRRGMKGDQRQAAAVRHDDNQLAELRYARVGELLVPPYNRFAPVVARATVARVSVRVRLLPLKPIRTSGTAGEDRE